MHLDHLGGLTNGGKKNFPNAVVRARFEQAKASPAPNKASDKFNPFDGAGGRSSCSPGLRSSARTMGGRKLRLIADMINVAVVRLPNPAATLLFDSNTKQAAAERIKDFGIAAKSNDLVATAHSSFPGIGHIRTAGSGFSFTPLAYGSPAR